MICESSRFGSGVYGFTAGNLDCVCVCVKESSSDAGCK